MNAVHQLCSAALNYGVVVSAAQTFHSPPLRREDRPDGTRTDRHGVGQEHAVTTKQRLFDINQGHTDTAKRLDFKQL